MERRTGPLVARVLPALILAAVAAACDTGGGAADADVPADVPGDAIADVPADAPDVPDPGYGFTEDLVNVDVAQAFLPEPPAGKEWRLAFHDEFDGTSVDTGKWTVSQGKGRTNVYDPRSVILAGDGLLTMRVFEENGTYYTGGLDTRGKWHQAKGYFEARVKFQRQGGHWSAFWLYSETICGKEPGAVDGAELDVFERPWTLDYLADFTQRTIHWDCHEGKKENPQEIKGVKDGWHTWGMWWGDDAYVFYTDGVETWRSTDGGICQAPLYMLLTDEIEDGRWFGAGLIGEATLPDEWQVDYVRVFELAPSELPSAAPSPGGSAR